MEKSLNKSVIEPPGVFSAPTPSIVECTDNKHSYGKKRKVSWVPSFSPAALNSPPRLSADVFFLLFASLKIFFPFNRRNGEQKIYCFHIQNIFMYWL